MQVLVVGSGPAGLILGAASAVVAITSSRWTGTPALPPTAGDAAESCSSHTRTDFRPQVGKILAQEWPAAYDALDASRGDPGRGGAEGRQSPHVEGRALAQRNAGACAA